MTALDDAIRRRIQRQAAEAQAKPPNPLASAIARNLAGPNPTRPTTQPPKEPHRG
ncbi:hypothetical protein [Streptomyces sp. NPDC058632]|uniref:hypothetical protein n=1 Tax=Streptomyces sp. NPDC058632 TaxID=3346567 RepID=UPI00365248EA